MSKMKKIFLLVFVAISVLFIALLILASVLITPERVRETVLPLAEDALERKVELGRIEVSLFSGISLQDMAVRKRDGRGDFISAEKVVLRYSLLKLLMLKVEIDEITLLKPRLNIIRNRDKSFNFSDLAAAPAVPAASASKSDNTVSTGSSALDLHISKINIEDGQLLFIDNSGQGKPERHEVSAFNLQAKNVSTSRKFPLDLSAVWNGNMLGLNGQIDVAGMAADLKARFNKIEIQVAGSMTGDKKVQVALILPKTKFQDIFASIPQEYAPGLTELGLAGNIALKLNINDDVMETSGFVVDINGQVLNVDLRAADLYGKPLAVKFKVSSESLNIDKLLPREKSPQDEPATDTTGKTPSEIGPFDIPVDLNGELQVRKLVYQELPVSDLSLKISLKNNILRLENMQAVVAGGQVNKTGKVDLRVKGLKYTAEFKLQGVQADLMVKALKPDLAETVQGVLDGEIQLSGSGTLPATIKKKLSGGGVIKLAGGKLQKIPALNSVAALLGVGELREVTIDNGDFNFTIKDGQVMINSEMTGLTTRLVTTGKVGLDGRLNLRTQLALSPELGGRLHEQGKLARYLGDEKGWTTVPLRIKGNYDSPEVGLDSKGLKKQAEKKVKQEIQRKIEKSLQKRLRGLFGN